MRIGFFTDTYTPQINGVVTSIRLFAKALERQGHTVYIFAPTPRQPSDGPRVIRIPSIPFVFQPEMRLAAIYSAHAYRLVRHANLDIVHAHAPFAIGLFGLAVSRRFRIPYVHTHHVVYPEYVHYVWETQLTRGLAEWLTKEFSDQCDTVLAPSTKIARSLTDAGVTSPVISLPTGVDARRFAPRDSDAADIAAFRKHHRIPAEARLLTFVGRLGLEKNVDLLIDALARIETPEARLMIVGNGPHRDELVKHLKKAGVTDRAILTGYLGPEDVRIAYHASEALFFASTSETQGLVITEAMAASLPVIAVEDLAIADAVETELNGLLVPASAAALASAADRLLADDALRTRMGIASRAKAEELSIDNQAALLAAVYEGLLETHPSPRRVGDRRRAVRRRVLRQVAVMRRRGDRLVRRYL
jgi:1,2-diacylglycerol 3-alpha-glucosyltransferase